MTKTEIERLAVVESQIVDVKESQERIETKLDAAIECKADKSEVAHIASVLERKADAADLKAIIEKKANADDFKEMRNLLVGILVSVAGFALITLVGIVLLRIGLG